MTEVKETKPKGAKVDHSKPTRPKLGRAKLARAYKRLVLEIEAEQDHPEGRLTQATDGLGSSKSTIYFK